MKNGSLRGGQVDSKKFHGKGKKKASDPGDRVGIWDYLGWGGCLNKRREGEKGPVLGRLSSWHKV